MNLTPEKVLIIVTSDEDLTPYGNSPKHYLETLAEKYEVHFVGPALPWKLSNLFRKPVRGNSSGVQTHQYLNVLPLRMFPRLTLRINDFINVHALRKNLNPAKKVIWWKFDSTKMIFTETKRDELTIYHVRDPYMGRRTDRLLANSAHLIVVVNHVYINYYKQFNENVIYIPHGINTRDTSVNEGRIGYIKKTMRPYLLMAGSINDDLDFELLIKVANKFTNYTLLLLGIYALKSVKQQLLYKELCKLKNVMSPGAVDYYDLKNYVNAAMVCLVAYNEKKVGFHRNPIKITNYIAMKKPVMNTVAIPELEELESKVVFTSTNHDDYLDKLQMLIEQKLWVDNQFVESYIQNHTYQKLSCQIMVQLEYFLNND